MIALPASMDSCSPTIADLDIARFVVRFDAEQCSNVRSVQSARSPVATQSGSGRIYIADVDCIDALHHSFKTIGFRKIGEQSFQYRSTRGWSEKITLTPTEDREETRIEWEFIEA